MSSVLIALILFHFHIAWWWVWTWPECFLAPDAYCQRINDCNIFLFPLIFPDRALLKVRSWCTKDEELEGDDLQTQFCWKARVWIYVPPSQPLFVGDSPLKSLLSHALVLVLCFLFGSVSCLQRIWKIIANSRSVVCRLGFAAERAVLQQGAGVNGLLE